MRKMNGFFVLASLGLLFLAGCSSSTLDRTAYTLEYEVTGTAPTVNISAVIPDGTDVGPGGAVVPPWSHTEEGTVDFTNPTGISLSADGLLQPAEAESITATITYTLQDFEDVQTKTVTNTHPTVPSTKTATVISVFPIQP